MKKLFYLTLTSIVLSFGYSCSGSSSDIIDQPITEGTEYNVKVNLSGFSSEIENLKSVTEEDNAITNLVYQVYDKTNNVVVLQQAIKEETQISSLDIKLRKGEYSISIFASNKPMTTQIVSLSTGEFEGDNIKGSDLALTVEDLSNPTLFQGSVDVTVTGENTTTNIVLSRPIGKISLALTDLNLMPDEVKSITPILVRRSILLPPYDGGNEDGGYYTVPKYIEISSGINYYYDMSATDSNKSEINIFQTITLNRSQFLTVSENTPFSFYLPQTERTRRNQSYSAGYEAEYDIYLIGSKTEQTQFAPVDRPEGMTDIPDLVFMTRIAKGVTIKANKQIIIEGKFFDTDHLTVTVNDVWGETIENEF